MKKVLVIMFTLVIGLMSIVTAFAAEPDTSDKNAFANADLETLMQSDVFKNLNIIVKIDDGEAQKLSDIMTETGRQELQERVAKFPCESKHTIYMALLDAEDKVILENTQDYTVEHTYKDGVCTHCGAKEPTEAPKDPTNPSKPTDATESTKPTEPNKTEPDDKTTGQSDNSTTTQKENDATTKTDETTTTTKKADTSTTTKTAEPTRSGKTSVIPNTGSRTAVCAIATLCVAAAAALVLKRKGN